MITHIKYNHCIKYKPNHSEEKTEFNSYSFVSIILKQLRREYVRIGIAKFQSLDHKFLGRHALRVCDVNFLVGDVLAVENSLDVFLLNFDLTGKNQIQTIYGQLKFTRTF